MVKGVLHPADASRVHDVGADGLIVSNHGGRQLDGTMSPLSALPEIVARIGNKTTVMVDGGFRRGTDIIRHWRWAHASFLSGGLSSTRRLSPAVQLSVKLSIS